jgi:hypothetical protein
MRNFACWISREWIGKMIEAHSDFLGNSISKNILEELEDLEEEYLPNLKCSKETQKFIDEFISDLKNYEQTGEGSVYAEMFFLGD